MSNNMFAGDEVIVKVQRISPTITQVWIDSKARGQIGSDLGRTDRNVTELAATLRAGCSGRDVDAGERPTP